MTILRGRLINLAQLQGELAAAGVVVPKGLTQDGDLVHTYDADDQPIDLPAQAQAVVDAHIAIDTGAQIQAAVMTIAQSTVGLQLTALTTLQQRALLACLLFKAGGVSPAMTVLPLNQWVR